jgi:hypothetical protein
MKIELSNGVVVIPTPEITAEIKEILFAREILENAQPDPKEDIKYDPKLSQKFRSKFKDKSEEAKPTKDGWTQEEINNLIAMKGNGIDSGEIARKLSKTATMVYSKVYALKKSGEIKDKPNPEEPAKTDSDGFRKM